MTKLEELKIAHSEASINLEIAQAQFSQVKQELISEMNRVNQNGKKPREVNNESVQISEPCS